MKSGPGKNFRHAWPSVDEIDPASVPDWPRPVVTVGPEGIAIDGETVDLPAGVVPTSTEARQAALRAAAARFSDLRRPIMVRAREADGTAWDLIVGPDGAVAPAADTPVETAGRKTKRSRGRKKRNTGRSAGPDRKRGLVAVGGFLGVVALLLAGVLVTTQLSETPLAVRRASPSTPPPANLPITAPPGYQARAVWATEVADAEGTGVVLLPGRQVAMLAGADRLEVRDVSTGILRWDTDLSSPMATEGALRLTRIGGELVLTLSDTTSLRYWGLDEEHDGGRIPLPEGSTEVSFDGGSPLVSLSDQTAGYVEKGEVRLVDVPVGAKAVSSDGSQVLAVDGSGRLWRLRSGQEGPPKPERLDPPAKGAKLLSATGLPNGRFAAAWQHGADRLAILSESPGGEELAREDLEYDDSYQESAQGEAEQGDVAIVSSGDGDVVVVDDAVFFTRKETAMRVSGLTVGSVGGGHVYGTDSTGNWFDVTVTGRERVAGEESAPVAVDDAGAFVVTTKLGKELLYLLPPAPQATPLRPGERTPTPTKDGD